jgi:nucleoside-diphosphate-sugar epimerase
MSFLDVARTLERLCPGCSWHHAPFSSERAAQEPGDFYSDITKIRTVVGWEPRTELEDGLRRTLDYYRQHRDHYWSPPAAIPQRRAA